MRRLKSNTGKPVAVIAEGEQGQERKRSAAPSGVVSGPWSRQKPLPTLVFRGLLGLPLGMVIFATLSLVLTLAADAPAEEVAIATGAGACPNGYRPQSLLWDYALGRQWTVFASCLHPEFPRIAIADSRTASAESPNPAGGRAGLDDHDFSQRPGPEVRPALSPASADRRTLSTSPVLVQAGSRVRLWRRDGLVQVDLAGTALASGGPGAAIRVRVAAGGKVLSGRVRDAGSVELDPGSGAGFAEAQ